MALHAVHQHLPALASKSRVPVCMFAAYPTETLDFEPRHEHGHNNHPENTNVVIDTISNV
jgi:hypothetical protein